MWYLTDVEWRERRREEESAAEIYINFKDVASVAWVWTQAKKKKKNDPGLKAANSGTVMQLQPKLDRCWTAVL